MNYLDRALEAVAPRLALKRARARLATELIRRNYDAVSGGRRTQGWRRGLTGDAASSTQGLTLQRLRGLARDLTENNPYAVGGALDTIEAETIGWGIMPATDVQAFETWATTTQCDAQRRTNLAGLERAVLRAVVQDGEVLIRRRNRRSTDGLAIPLQLEVLEADFLDTAKNAELGGGRRVVQGVEFGALGQRQAYYLFRRHPGSSTGVVGNSRLVTESRRVPASEVLHVFEQRRPGQVRGVSWFAPTMLRFRDFDDYEDATLMKQKAAACLAIITTDPDGTGPAMGQEDENNPTTDTLEPGAIVNIAPGRSVDLVNPPRVNEHEGYSKTVLRAIAVGLGVTYEDLAGDYTGLPFSAARMSRLRFNSKIQKWRWGMLEPLFLDPVWSWAGEAAELVGLELPASTEWTAPGLPMIEPDKEGPAIQRNIRGGILTQSEALRERGYNPRKFWKEYRADLDNLDALEIMLDSDPRRTSQQGQLQNGVESPVATSASSSSSSAGTNGSDDSRKVRPAPPA